MTVPLIDLATLTNHSQVFVAAAAKLGFSSLGDIDRFLYKSYGKALRDIPPADRPQGAIFFLAPAGSAGAFASISHLGQAIRQIQTEVDTNRYQIPLDLSGNASVVQAPTADERRFMASGAWTEQHAQMVSRQTGHCVVWANGVGASVYLAGDCYRQSPDVVEEMPSGLPANFQALSWDDGAITFEFAQHELNDTSPAGIWQLPDHCLLRPKPEKLMSIALGKFLRMRMAGYRHHEDEPYVENEGRADVVLYLYNGFIYIVEVKWVGCSLSSKKELEAKDAVEAAAKTKMKGWLTEYDDTTFVEGTKQLAKYFGTTKYKFAYLTVFDCHAASTARKNERLMVNPTHVAPHSAANFRILRACVDPRKASKSSKAKKP